VDLLRPGDTLVITRIDRVARSLRDLHNIVHELREKGAYLKAIEQTVDTSTAAGNVGEIKRLPAAGIGATQLANPRHRQGQRVAAGVLATACQPGTWGGPMTEARSEALWLLMNAAAAGLALFLVGGSFLFDLIGLKEASNKYSRSGESGEAK
jgi:hypothetical protein